jgi:hypothetical protein
LRFNKAQPVGKTAAANATLITSPGRYGNTVILNATTGGVLVKTENHAKPPRKMIADPINIATTAV